VSGNKEKALLCSFSFALFRPGRERKPSSTTCATGASEVRTGKSKQSSDNQRSLAKSHRATLSDKVTDVCCFW